MYFSSIIFIVYFLPVTIAGHYLLRFSRHAQNMWLLIASLVFYAWGEPAIILFLIFSILINYLLVFVIGKSRENRIFSLPLTVLTCVFNIAALFVCKQLMQIIGGVMYFLPVSSEFVPYMTTPVGVSFFTLRAVSYAIEVYKGGAEPPKNPVNTALYLAFFPTFIAGPFIRYADMGEQLLLRKETWQGFSTGVCRFITGLAKQVLIANNMAAIADHVFSYSAMSNELTQVPASMAWLGAIAFALQIYFDLSGYSDMAIGLGQMFGFKIAENFDYPYTSLSISEFWSRWNITLIGWFREYIFLPLGGSFVKNNDVMVRNLFIMWFLMGLWHGAKWTLILWSMWQFIFLIFERVISYDKRKIPNPIRRFFVLLTVLLGFVIFRTDDIYQATLYISNMFGFNHNGFYSDTALMFVREYWLFLAAGILFSTPVAKKISGAVNEGYLGKLGTVFSVVYPALMIASFYITMAYMLRGINHPFIYFRL